MRGDLRVVRRQDDRHLVILAEPDQQLHDLGGVHRVQVAGRLVGRQQVTCSFPLIKGCPVRQHWCHHIVHGGERGQQVVALEHEANGAAVGRERSAVTSCPLLTIVPESGRSIAPMRCSKVDLPDPDAPVRAMNPPAATPKLTSSAGP
jgi:hypothetical protein